MKVPGVAYHFPTTTSRVVSRTLFEEGFSKPLCIVYITSIEKLAIKSPFFLLLRRSPSYTGNYLNLAIFRHNIAFLYRKYQNPEEPPHSLKAAAVLDGKSPSPLK